METESPYMFLVAPAARNHRKPTFETGNRNFNLTDMEKFHIDGML